MEDGSRGQEYRRMDLEGGGGMGQRAGETVRGGSAGNRREEEGHEVDGGGEGLGVRELGRMEEEEG